ncbi:MAG TPA: NHLP bacteriocin system secretion protein [Azospirillum sp.]|nr:NHLP bacteriocin system secretion protein [Azospirillum sp.]
MTEGLYRKEAIDHLGAIAELEDGLTLTPPATWAALAVLGALIAAAVAWSVVTHVPVSVSGQGILINPGGIVDVISATQGRIEAVLVRPGDRVQAGQVVARVDQTETAIKLEQLQGQLADARQQRGAVAAYHDRAIRATQELLAEQERALRLRVGILQERRKWLHERGTHQAEPDARTNIARQQLIDARVEINTIDDAIAQAEIQLVSLRTQTEERILQRDRELFQIGQKIEELERMVAGLKESLARSLVITSPHGGRVAELKATHGEYATPGKAIVGLLRDRPDADGAPVPLEAVLYLPPRDGKKVAPGMSVFLAPSTVDHETYGFMTGRVAVVAAVPSSTEGMLLTLKNDQLVRALSGEGAPFEVRVALNADPATPSGYAWTSSLGPPVGVDPGTLTEGRIVTERVPAAALAIPTMQRLLGKAP